jgi:hypothetical protein
MKRGWAQKKSRSIDSLVLNMIFEKFIEPIDHIWFWFLLQKLALNCKSLSSK